MFRNDLVLAPKRPPKFCEEICSQFGKNIYGENLWRVIWMPDRILINGGYWEEDGLFTYRRTRRYGKKPCWGLERYVGGRAFGNPEEWAARTFTEGRFNQGSFPLHGAFLATAVFTTNLSPQLIKAQLRSVSLGKLAGDFTTRDIILSEYEKKEQADAERLDQEWNDIDNPRRGLTYTAGGQRVNQFDNDVFRKAAEIAANTGGKIRDAGKLGFSQIKDLEELQ